MQPENLSGDDEIEWRAREDAQDGELFRLAAYTRLRLGELVRCVGKTSTPTHGAWLFNRAVSADVEGADQELASTLPSLADPAAEALKRLQARGDYTQPAA